MPAARQSGCNDYMGTTNAYSPSSIPGAGFFYALAFLLALGACLAVPRLLSFLPALLGVACLVWIKLRTGAFPPFDKDLAKFLAAIIALAALSALWAPHPDYAFERSLKIAGVLFPALAMLAAAKFLPASGGRKNTFVLAAALICMAAGAIFFCEYFFRFPLMRFYLDMNLEDMPENMRNGFVLNRAAVFLSVAVAPVALMVLLSGLHKKIQYACLAGLAASTGAYLYAADSQSAQIAALFGLIMLFYPAHRKKARHILLGVILALMAFAPFLVKPAHDIFFSRVGEIESESFLQQASIPHRLEVWNFAADKIMESPLYGHGVDSMRFLKSETLMKHMRSDTVMHPHNAVLQIWLEFGVIGIALAMAFVFFLFRRIDTLPPAQQRYYTLLFVMLLSILSTGYGLWQAWLLGMIPAVTAMSVMAVRLNSEKP